ncbi:MAG: family 16 glycosylhydrolase [Elusimicrobiota bacterium]
MRPVLPPAARWLFLLLFPAAVWGATPIFDDEFYGNELNSSAWIKVSGRHNYNNEQQCYVPSADTVADGNLVITSNQASVSCATGSGYASGMVQWRSYNFTYGTIEYRAKMAGGQGAWPAIWLLGANCQAANPSDTAIAPCQWPLPGSNEIDLTEINFQDMTTVWQNVFAPSYPVSEYSCLAPVSDVSQNWHTYSFTWTPNSLTWKIDGITTCTRTEPQLIPSTPMFLMINTALGGNVGGVINNATLPQTMLVDYVRVTPADAVQSGSNGFFRDTVHNYPNPFFLGRGSTKFVVETSEGGSVDLQIFDAGEQFVTALSGSITGAGRMDLIWDGRNSKGGYVSPGLYFVRIHGQGVHDEIQFRRVVAVK